MWASSARGSETSDAASDMLPDVPDGMAASGSNRTSLGTATRQSRSG